MDLGGMSLIVDENLLKLPEPLIDPYSLLFE